MYSTWTKDEVLTRLREEKVALQQLNTQINQLIEQRAHIARIYLDLEARLQEIHYAST